MGEVGFLAGFLGLVAEAYGVFRKSHHGKAAEHVVEHDFSEETLLHEHLVGGGEDYRETENDYQHEGHKQPAEILVADICVLLVTGGVEVGSPYGQTADNLGAD